MQITGILRFNFGQSLYSGQAATCSRIAPSGHGLHATSGQEHAEPGQEYVDLEHKHAGCTVRAPHCRICAPPLLGYASLLRIPAPPLWVPALRWRTNCALGVLLYSTWQPVLNKGIVKNFNQKWKKFAYFKVFYIKYGVFFTISGWYIINILSDLGGTYTV